MIFVFSVECWILCKRGDFKYFMDCLFEIMYDYMISSIASHGFVLKMILVLFHLVNLNLILGGWILLQLPQVNFKWSCFSLSSKQMNRPPNTISRELFPRGALIFFNHCIYFSLRAFRPTQGIVIQKFVCPSVRPYDVTNLVPRQNLRTVIGIDLLFF